MIGVGLLLLLAAVLATGETLFPVVLDGLLVVIRSNSPRGLDVVERIMI